MDSTLGTALSGLFGTVVALGIVLGLAYGSLRLLRRWQDGNMGRAGGADGGPTRTLRFVRALPLGQRERLVLVEVEGELMLVGVSAGGIGLLKSWGAGSAASAGAAPAALDDGAEGRA